MTPYVAAVTNFVVNAGDDEWNDAGAGRDLIALAVFDMAVRTVTPTTYTFDECAKLADMAVEAEVSDQHEAVSRSFIEGWREHRDAKAMERFEREAEARLWGDRSGEELVELDPESARQFREVGP